MRASVRAGPYAVGSLIPAHDRHGQRLPKISRRFERSCRSGTHDINAEEAPMKRRPRDQRRSGGADAEGCTRKAVWLVVGKELRLACTRTHPDAWDVCLVCVRACGRVREGRACTPTVASVCCRARSISVLGTDQRTRSGLRRTRACVRACVCARVCALACACVRVQARACVRARVRAWVCCSVHAWDRVGVRARV